MSISKIAVFGIVAAALALSCAPSVSHGGDYGTVQVGFGNSAARAFATGWPGATLPTFSSVTVKVTGTGMSPVTATASGFSGSISVQVPAGNNRLVELTAVPAAGSGAPEFAKSYYGTATVNLTEGQTTAITIKLSLGESKIVMPKDGLGVTPSVTLIADSLTSGVTATIEDEAWGFTFDNYGRLYMGSNNTGFLLRYASVAGTAEGIDDYYTPNALAYDASKNRLYAMNNGDGWILWYLDVGATTLTDISIQLPSGYSVAYSSRGLAVDAQGFLYLVLLNSASETNGIAKLSIGAFSGESAPATLVGFTPLSSLGLGSDLGLEVVDLRAQGGALYIAATGLEAGSNYIDYLYSRGKLVAVDASSLSKLWETGWAGDAAHFPSAPNKNTQFFGPLAFVAVSPKKLYIADEGFYWDGTPSTYAQAISRVLEVDLDTHQITGVGLEDLYFVDDYQFLFIYGPA
jgi:hypothetical protein